MQSTGTWNGQAKLCFHKVLSTVFNMYCSWFVSLPLRPVKGGGAGLPTVVGERGVLCSASATVVPSEDCQHTGGMSGSDIRHGSTHDTMLRMLNKWSKSVTRNIVLQWWATDKTITTNLILKQCKNERKIIPNGKMRTICTAKTWKTKIFWATAVCHPKPVACCLVI